MSSKATIRPVYFGERVPPEDFETATLNSGDKAAFENVAHCYDRAILSLFLHLTGSEPEALQLCRATFLAAYRAAFRRRDESAYVWMFRLAVKQWLRRSPCPPPRPRNGSGGLSLSDRERLVFCLKSDEHLELATVARILDEPAENVANTFTRAVAKLRMQSASADVH